MVKVPSIRRKPTRKQRVMKSVRRTADAAGMLVKARLAWMAGKRMAKVAGPAVAVGTAAVVVKKRTDSSKGPNEAMAPPPVDAAPV